MNLNVIKGDWIKMNKEKVGKKNINKQLMIMAAPLLLGDIFQQFYNTIDAVIVGKYIGKEAFAAIGIAGAIMNLFIFLLGGCCTGISIILAQLNGQKNEKSFRQERFIALSFGTGFSIILGIFSIIMLPLILHIIQTPTNLIALIQEYLNIIFVGLAVTFWYNLNAVSLRAVGNTKMALLFLIISILVNVLLDILFVVWFQMGISGVAFATVLAQCVSALSCEWYLHKYMPHMFLKKEDCVFRKDLLIQTVKIASISAMQQSSLYIGKMLVQGSVNRLGVEQIAAYTAAGRIEGFINSFGNSGSDAISILVAQKVGANNLEGAREYFIHGLFLLVILAIILAGGIYFYSNTLLQMLIYNSVDAIKSGEDYLQIIVMFYILCFIGCAFVGWYRGNGQVQIPFIGTTMLITLRALLSMVLCSSIGLKGVAVSTGIGWIVVVLFHGFVYYWRGTKKRING